MSPTHSESPKQRVVQAFRDQFGEPAMVVRGPGRVNLIGEHTDYNQGFVLPAAVDKAIWLALRPRQDGRLRAFSTDLGGGLERDLGDLARSEVTWANYLLGILSELTRDGHRLGGVDVVFGGDLPIGSGMSSSAALECGFAFGLNALFGLGLGAVDLALLGQRAENRFVGVNCGIMDQFASVLGREGNLLRLDCRDLTCSFVPFGREDLRLVLCDTQVRRALAAGSAYNARRAQCEAVAAGLGLPSLREATAELLEAHAGAFDPESLRRCAYVVAENGRVREACEALGRGDFQTFGALMNASHAGLSREYEVSCEELDVLAEAAQALPGVLGSRMMGAGFGGCTLNLVEGGALADFRGGMGEVFGPRLGKEPVLHVCRLPGGPSRVGVA